MVRNYQRKTERGKYGTGGLALALEAVRAGMPILKASRVFSVPPRTIRRHRDGGVANPGQCHLGRQRTVLTMDIEREIHNHVQYMEKALFGLTTQDIRHLAFEVAEKSGFKHPFSQVTKMAGKDWLSGFLLRHPDLSIREPQGTNLSGVVGFNRPEVQQFFRVYRQLLATQDFTPARVWNMDETEVANVHEPGEILVTKGVLQVAKISRGERGKTVTAICAMNAAGTYLPPMFIFRKKWMAEGLLARAPPQSAGYSNESGWTDAELFLKWLEHFVQFTNASQENQHVIILDGHHSHKTLAAVSYAREHGIHLLTIPPHSTHKMQPLDRTYFKSLKSAYNSAANSWMIANPGKRITYCDITGIFGRAFLRSATAEKAVNGFACCGLWPCDENVFSDGDFAATTLAEEAEPTCASAPCTNSPPSASNIELRSLPVNGSALPAQSEAPPAVDSQFHGALRPAFGLPLNVPAPAAPEGGPTTAAGNPPGAAPCPPLSSTMQPGVYLRRDMETVPELSQQLMIKKEDLGGMESFHVAESVAKRAAPALDTLQPEFDAAHSRVSDVHHTDALLIKTEPDLGFFPTGDFIKIERLDHPELGDAPYLCPDQIKA